MAAAKGFGAKASFNYAGPLRPGKMTKALPVPKEIVRPDYAGDGIPKTKRSGRLPSLVVLKR